MQQLQQLNSKSSVNAGNKDIWCKFRNSAFLQSGTETTASLWKPPPLIWFIAWFFDTSATLTINLFAFCDLTFVNTSHLTKCSSRLGKQFCGIIAKTKRTFEHGVQCKTICCALESKCCCLFSVDRVYKCTTHPVSFVGSELSIALCVCVSEYFSVCVYTCLSGNWRCGPIWGVSEQAGVSHAGCSWFIANGIQSGSFFASKVSVPSHYGLANFGLMLFVSLCGVCGFDRRWVFKNKYRCIFLEGSWLVC